VPILDITMQYNSGFSRSSGEAIFPGFIFQMEMPSNTLCVPQERLSSKASPGRKFGGMIFVKKGVREFCNSKRCSSLEAAPAWNLGTLLVHRK